jgi:hypothetical protein
MLLHKLLPALLLVCVARRLLCIDPAPNCCALLLLLLAPAAASA